MIAGRIEDCPGFEFLLDELTLFFYIEIMKAQPGKSSNNQKEKNKSVRVQLCAWLCLDESIRLVFFKG